MKKALALLTFVCLSITTTFAATPTKRVTYKTYKTTEYNIRVPKLWEEEIAEEGSEPYIEASWQDGLGGSINVGKEDMMGETMKEYKKVAREHLLEIPGLTILSEKKSRGGILITSDLFMEDFGITVHLEQLILAHKGYAYIITTGAESSIYQDYSKVFSTVRRSFKLKKENVETISQGEKPRKGDTVVVDYVGTFDNGEKFDSSKDEGRTPLEFKIGSGSMIVGFEEAIKTMKKGETKKVRIKPSEAYGENGTHWLSGKYLNFEITLIDIKTGS